MRVVTNEGLIRRKRRAAQWLFFASFGILLLGLFVINAPATSPDLAGIGFLLSLLVLPVAYGATIASVRMTNLWVRLPRPETAIQEGLKGVGSKAVLYNYYHLPARHVLIAPQGVFAIATRFQDGRYLFDGKQWVARKNWLLKLLSFIRLDQIGNPHRDAEKAAAHVQALISPIAPDVPVQPLILFFDPRADVEVTETDVPIVHADPKRALSLKNYLKNLPRNGPTLTPQQIEAFEDATLN
ncbi:MAG: NERD domain-containing protein [Anaerolinea sp.]|nr:NERD domain-containing protein [Anaerolinea sp.]